jgi:hypothetical protein
MFGCRRRALYCFVMPALTLGGPPWLGIDVVVVAAAALFPLFVEPLVKISSTSTKPTSHTALVVVEELADKKGVEKTVLAPFLPPSHRCCHKGIVPLLEELHEEVDDLVVQPRRGATRPDILPSHIDFEPTHHHVRIPPLPQQSVDLLLLLIRQGRRPLSHLLLLLRLLGNTLPHIMKQIGRRRQDGSRNPLH